ncbi:MAG: cell division protein FtsL [Gammaproteobacteria bacterium]|nr:cell division protein FtsL [Gammaproteobacteria bacterium]MCP4473749.1 cell division protein FtsL [Gammaproteobacteria bacterium]
MINIHPNRVMPSAQIALITDNLRQYSGIISLVILVFLSALALVYVNDLHRQMMIKKEVLTTRALKIHNHWGQLLKQQSQLSNEMTIANEATHKLAMATPVRHHIVSVQL